MPTDEVKKLSLVEIEPVDKTLVSFSYSPRGLPEKNTTEVSFGFVDIHACRLVTGSDTIFEWKGLFYLCTPAYSVLPGSISQKSMNNNALYKGSEKSLVLPPVEIDSVSESQLAVARVERQLKEGGFIASER